ncbi:MAG: DUF4249 domain-containing protein [Bacteroidetes bacterium]|nr:DUF4249 domain-containing protein [Bacteroidota bacterium]
MKNKLLLFSLLSAGIFGLFSCEQKVTYQLPQYDPKPAVFCLLQPDSVVKLYLTESRSYFNYGDTLNKMRFIFDAVLTVKDETGVTETLHLEKGLENDNNFNRNPWDTTKRPDNKVETWLWVGSNKTKANTKYSLEIKWGGKSYTAETRVPDVPVILNTIIRKTEGRGFGGGGQNDSIKTAFFVVQDVAAEKNFYGRLEIDSNSNQSGGSSGYFDNIYRYSFTEDGAENGRKMEVYASEDQKRGGFPTDSTVVFVSLMNANKEAGDYLTSLQHQQNTQGDPFSEPVLIKSNIKGGLGVFGGMSYSKKYRIVFK